MLYTRQGCPLPEVQLEVHDTYVISPDGTVDGSFLSPTAPRPLNKRLSGTFEEQSAMQRLGDAPL